MALSQHLTQTGAAVMNNILDGGQALPTFYACIGTGAGVAAVTDTAMSIEDTTSARHACTLSRTTTSFTNDTWTFTCNSFPVGANETMTEIGIFDALTGGNMIAHATGYSAAVGSGNGVPNINITVNVQQQPQ